jgi:SAM-dependent methyltransferase
MNPAISTQQGRHPEREGVTMKKAFQDRTSWYDGYLFEKIMEKRSREMFVGPISAFIEEGASVIDIGCGIGSLVLNLSPVCSKVVGIDVSSKMIAYAKKRQKKEQYPNVEFHHLCASLLAEVFPDTFEYGVMGQMLHEISEEIRDTILRAAKKVATKLIIADYRTPLPRNMYGMMITFVESIAGAEHNRNFKSWQANGGIDSFLVRHGLQVEEVAPYQLGGKEIGIGKIVKVSYTA